MRCYQGINGNGAVFYFDEHGEKVSEATAKQNLISLAENYLGRELTPTEEQKVKDAIVRLTEERRTAVLRGAAPR